MLTEQQIKEMNEQLTVLKSEKVEKKAKVLKLNSTIDEAISLWMSNLIGKNVVVSLRYDYDYNFNVDPYEKTPYATVSIKQIENDVATFEFVDIKVKKDTITYDMWSGKFTHDDVGRMTSIKLIAALQLDNNEEELRQLCFKMLSNYEALEKDYYNKSYEVSSLEKQLQDNEDEVKRNKALESLKEGALYIDGAAQDWYLKVMKVTNKTVKCRAYYDYRSYYKPDNEQYGLNYMNDRQIKKDDFINRLATDYYKPLEEEIKLVDPSWLED